jgi:RNA 2',3'-cyclic 3'-phosphodiesterase
MRLFVALDLTPAIREEISQFCANMRAAMPDARWVRVESIHVTLKFIGEVKEDIVPKIREALAKVHSSAGVDLNVHGVGFFPNARRPRVFWAGMEASSNLANIAAQVETALEPIGIPRESREFRPHLTLARIESPRGIAALHGKLCEAGDVQFGSMRTSEMHLMQSELLRDGARHTRVAIFTFVDER